MSATDGKWQLGVVVSHDSFEDYDQFTRLGAQYVFGGDLSPAVQDVVLDSGIASDYRQFPFCLRGQLKERDSAGRIPGDGGYTGQSGVVAGNELILGPSSNSTYDGAIERCTTGSFTTNNYTPTLVSNQNFTYITLPSSTYEQNDQVLVRSLPLGWTPVSAFEDEFYSLQGIRRYDDRETQLKIRDAFSGGTTGVVSIDTELAHRYGQQIGLRVAANTAQERANQKIYMLTDTNSADPRVRRWRASWYYRLVRAYTASNVNSNSIIATVTMSGCKADGTVLVQETGEASGTLTKILKTYNDANSSTAEWQMDTALFSAFGGLGGDTNAWSYNANNNPNKASMNRLNRLRVEIGLTRGVNTAFDVDDLIIEHAQGTSHEANGFFEFGWPEQGTVTWQPRVARQGRFITASNRLRIPKTSISNKPRFLLSAEFQHMNTQDYLDLMALLQWQERGNLLCLRTWHNALPTVMVGYMDIRRWDSAHFDLGMPSFTLQFEEA